MQNKNISRWLIAAICSAGISTVVIHGARAEDKDEREEKMAMDKIPAAVRATIMKEADGTAVADVDKEQDDGKTIYEADAKIGATNYEIKVAEDGTLISKKIDKEDDEKDGDKDKDKKERD